MNFFQIVKDTAKSLYAAQQQFRGDDDNPIIAWTKSMVVAIVKFQLHCNDKDKDELLKTCYNMIDIAYKLKAECEKFASGVFI